MVGEAQGEGIFGDVTVGTRACAVLSGVVGGIERRMVDGFEVAKKSIGVVDTLY